MRRGILQLLFAAGSIVFAVVFYLNTLRLPRAAYQTPRLIAYLIVILALAMMVTTYLSMRRGEQGEAGRVSTSGTGNGQPQPQGDIAAMASHQEVVVDLPRVVIFALMIFGYVFTIERVGYFITTPVFVLVSLLYLRATRLVHMIVIALAFTLFVYLLFVRFLNLPVPMGIMAA